MTYEGDNFDILTGILAIPTALLAWRLKSVLWPAWIFSLLGIFLLLRVLFIVNLSRPSPLRDWLGGYETVPDVVAGLYFSYVWIATVAVPAALFSHLFLLRRLTIRHAGEPAQQHFENAPG